MFEEKFKKDLLSNKENIYVAFSGGADSVALLHYCSVLKNSLLQNRSIYAIHINHQISSKSKEWSNFCEDFCNEHDINFISKTISIPKDYSSLESAARKKRYDAFRNIIKNDGALVLAHHLDDRVETLLYRMFRGTGIDGLISFRETVEYKGLRILRPLIAIQKAEILEYVQNHSLIFTEDESNKDLSFDRNYIRHEILPKILHRWPSANLKIADLASFAEENNQLKENYLQDLANHCLLNNQLSISQVNNLDRNSRDEIIRFWIKKSGYALPNKNQLYEIIKVFFQSNPTKNSYVQWSRADENEKGCRIVCNRKMLILEDIL